MPVRKYRSFNTLSTLISRESLEEYYITKNHSLTDTMQYFNIADTELDYLLRGYHLTGIKKIKYSSDENFKAILQKAGGYEVVYKYFITEKHTINESAAHFGLTRGAFRVLLRKYNIKKNHEDAAATQKRFMYDTYGVYNPFQLPEVKEKITETFLERYGVEHAFQYKEFLNKAIDTSIERHGDNFRMQSSNNSGPNRLMETALTNMGVDFSREFRIDTQFFDFKAGKYLIEINPTITHNSYWSPYGDHISKIDKTYHSNKRALGMQAGYHVISIFDWMDLNLIVDLFFKDRTKIYARQCEAKLICKNEFAKYAVKDFLNANHIQGYPRLGQEYAIGLFYKNELVAIQTWGKSRYNKTCKFELYRQATRLDLSIVGGNEKMFACFQKNVNINKEKLISYCDYNLFLGTTYTKLGFKLVANPKPTKHWVYIGNKIPGMTENQQHFTDNLVRANGFDRLIGNLFGTFGKGTSNVELLHKFNYVEVYDCGQATYIWEK